MKALGYPVHKPWLARVLRLVRARETLEEQDFEPVKMFHALKLQRLWRIAQAGLNELYSPVLEV